MSRGEGGVREGKREKQEGNQTEKVLQGEEREEGDLEEVGDHFLISISERAEETFTHLKTKVRRGGAKTANCRYVCCVSGCCSRGSTE